MFANDKMGGNTLRVDQPTWNTNPSRRTIPNHLVSKRRPGFQITNPKSGREKQLYSSRDNSQSFDLVTFGSPTKKSTGNNIDSRVNSTNLYDTTTDITKYDETINKTLTDEFSLHDYDDDLPPSRSIYDLNDEFLLSLNKPMSNNHNESFINKDPKNYNNIFNRTNLKPEDKKDGSGATMDSNPALSNSQSETVPGFNSGSSNSDANSINPLNNGESAILVFGYPEHLANQVINYFKDFGNILEDFEINKNSKKNFLHNIAADNSFKSTTTKKSDKIIPCFTGKSWVKITYDNPASALEALQQNGVVFNGSLLGVIPYSKDAIEKLQNRKLNPNEDIGGKEFGFKNYGTKLPTELNYDDSKIMDNSNYTNSTKLFIQDGSNLFQTNNYNSNANGNSQNAKTNIDTKNNPENLGFWGNCMKYVFGFNEL